MIRENDRYLSPVEVRLETRPEDTSECTCEFCQQPAIKTYIGEFSFDSNPQIYTKSMPGYICKSDECKALAKKCASEEGEPENWESWLPRYLSGEAIYEMASQASKILVQYGNFNQAFYFER